MGRTRRGGGSAKTVLAPQTNRDGLTSTWLGKSCDQHETLTGGSTAILITPPSGPGPLEVKQYTSRERDIKSLFPGKYSLYANFPPSRRDTPQCCLA